MTAYATRDDVYRQGAPRGSFSLAGRLVSRVDATNNVLEIDAHGFADEATVTVRADEGSALPTPLVAGTVYYVITTEQENQLQLATTAGGSAIDLTDEGGSFAIASTRDVGLMIDDAIEYASRLFDGMAIAHTVPLESPFPMQVTKCVAVIAAYEVMTTLIRATPQLTARAITAREDLKVFARGVGLRDARAPSTSNLATGASPSSTSSQGCIP